MKVTSLSAPSVFDLVSLAVNVPLVSFTSLGLKPRWSLNLDVLQPRTRIHREHRRNQGNAPTSITTFSRDFGIATNAASTAVQLPAAPDR